MLRVDTLQDLFVAAETLARFRANRSETMTVFANGAGAGQSVPHLHIHVLGGRRMTWPPG